MNKFFNSNRKAFTLAEVLIVLGIIGIVAELTIPDLYANFQVQVYKTAYKKAFSVASQAWQLAINDGLYINHSDPTSWNYFKNEFKIIKECPNGGDVSQCWSSDGDAWNGGYPSAGSPAFIDSSGFAWARTTPDTNSGRFLVDTNGFKGPNQFGKDRFPFVPSTSSGSSFTDYITIMPDNIAPDAGYCIHGNCYYTSWIEGGP